MNITQKEYQDWKDLCGELSDLGIDINNQGKLHELMTGWAESYRLLHEDQKI